jgi:hypothetical protein
MSLRPPWGGLPPPQIEAIATGSRSVDDAIPYVPDAALHGMALAGNSERVAERLAGAVRPGVTSITIRAYASPGEALRRCCGRS